MVRRLFIIAIYSLFNSKNFRIFPFNFRILYLINRLIKITLFVKIGKLNLNLEIFYCEETNSDLLWIFNRVLYYAQMGHPNCTHAFILQEIRLCEAPDKQYLFSFHQFRFPVMQHTNNLKHQVDTLIASDYRNYAIYKLQ